MFPTPTHGYPQTWQASTSSAPVCERGAKPAIRATPLNTHSPGYAPQPAPVTSPTFFAASPASYSAYMSPVTPVRPSPYLDYPPVPETAVNGYVDLNTGTFDEMQGAMGLYQTSLLFPGDGTPPASDYLSLTQVSAHACDLTNTHMNDIVDPSSPASPGTSEGRRSTRASKSATGKARPRTAQRKAESRYRSSMHDLWNELQDAVGQSDLTNSMTKPDILRAAIVQLKRFKSS